MLEHQNINFNIHERNIPFSIKTCGLSKKYASSISSLLSNRLISNSINGFDALTNVDVEIPKGTCFGIIGLNGSGKSTFLQLLAGILEPTSGTIETRGKISAIFELGSGFNPDFTGRENIAFYSRLVGVPASQVLEAEKAIIQFAEIGDFIDRPLSTYSSGMIARLGFATRAFLDFDILILDEVLSVGDAYFQRKCFRMLEDIRKAGKTIIFVSHSVNQVLEICDRAMLLHEGELLLEGHPKECAYAYFEIVNRKHKEWNEIERDEVVQKPDGGFDGRKGCVLDYSSSTGDSFENGFLFRFSERYDLIFNLTATCDLRELEFGLTLRSISGVTVSGRRSEIGDVQSGDKLVVTVGFNCSLNAGT